MLTRIISIIATAVLTAAAAALVYRGALLGTGSISVSLQVAGIALMVWSRLTFGLRSFHYAANPTQGGLVTAGPYRYIRNPIYAAAWLIIWTGVAVHWSAVNAALAGVVAVTLLIRIACEEQLLRVAYPEYTEYARKTSRLIPFVV
ncbi:MAG TPA: isoprenylcysteine carboxylmethyltransferase family protein [Candidatus Dormibacteraeota bacterium]|nr:isoprenylcysteine carboxylmethyltransferase family protein [Candidatus Dormibacteraeota bacterium]